MRAALDGVRNMAKSPGIVAQAKPTASGGMNPANPPSGYHSHACPSCGTSWTHGNENQGYAGPHVCPGCGAMVYQVYRGNLNSVPARALPAFRP